MGGGGTYPWPGGAFANGEGVKGSSRFFMGLFFLPSQESPQQSQQLRQRKHVQQQDIPQHAHRTMHVTMERSTRPAIIIAAMTGHLANY
jgi:hypothetical protein